MVYLFTKMNEGTIYYYWNEKAIESEDDFAIFGWGKEPILATY